MLFVLGDGAVDDRARDVSAMAEGVLRVTGRIVDRVVGTPVPLRRHLHPHPVDTVAERGWSELENGELLDQAEEEGFEVPDMVK